MTPNVFIKHYRRGKLVETREQHNVWTLGGRVYLAQMLGLSFAYLPERSDRLMYMGLGIGGKHRSPLATVPPFSVSYPAGSDPNATMGNEYDPDSPLHPPISTLELPVRFSGGVVAYPGAPGDMWLIGPPGLYTTHCVVPASRTDVTVHAAADPSGGDYTYGWFSQMPISEAGLYLDSAISSGVAYNALVAYVSFDTLLLDKTSYVEFIWHVRFC